MQWISSCHLGELWCSDWFYLYVDGDLKLLISWVTCSYETPNSSKQLDFPRMNYGRYPTSSSFSSASPPHHQHHPSVASPNLFNAIRSPGKTRQPRSHTEVVWTSPVSSLASNMFKSCFLYLWHSKTCGFSWNSSFSGPTWITFWCFPWLVSERTTLTWWQTLVDDK